MEALHAGQGISEQTESSLLGKDHRRYRAFAVFLICCAILVAAFAIAAVYLYADSGRLLGNKEHSSDQEEGETAPSTETSAPSSGAEEQVPPIPEGAIRIVKTDLVSDAMLSVGALLNETPYVLDTDALLARSVAEYPIGQAPLVLILHTHTSEAYLTENETYLEGVVGDLTYSQDASRNVLAVGEVLCRTLNAQGVPTLHCKTQHDSKGLGDSYANAAETVKWYLEQYPSIRYVIDLHRDSVLTSDGEYVRSMARGAEEEIAQVLAVVGSDCAGTDVPNMEANLALALQLRQKLNADGSTVCRAPLLKKSSYNQELCARSLLLEIGTGANTVEQACRAAECVGEALAELLKGE